MEKTAVGPASGQGQPKVFHKLGMELVIPPSAERTEVLVTVALSSRGSQKRTRR